MHSPLENTNFILVQRNWYSTKYKGYIFPFHLPPRKADLWFFPQTFYLVYSCMCACLWRHKIIWQITFWCKINRNFRRNKHNFRWLRGMQINVPRTIYLNVQYLFICYFVTIYGIENKIQKIPLVINIYIRFTYMHIFPILRNMFLFLLAKLLFFCLGNCHKNVIIRYVYVIYMFNINGFHQALIHFMLYLFTKCILLQLSPRDGNNDAYSTITTTYLIAIYDH